MVNVLIRLIRVLPILAIVAVATAVLYGLLVATSTRDKARRIIVKTLSVVNGTLTVVFTLITLYALSENNVYVLELADVCAALFAIVFVVVRICAWHMRCKQEQVEGVTPKHGTSKTKQDAARPDSAHPTAKEDQ